MFFVLEREKELNLHPRFFGAKLLDRLTEQLRAEVEGSCDGEYGYVVAVLQITNKSKGNLKDTTGFASYDVTYNCLVLRPFKNEVMDTLVTSVNKMGFFAEAGPLQIFVSSHLIPEDFEYSQLDEPAFVSGDEEVRIQAGTEVRLRIVGTRTDASEIFCVGSIKDNYLGVVASVA